MPSVRNLFALSAMLLLILSLAACESGPSPEEAAAALSEESWALLQKQKEELNTKRQELQELRERIANHADETAEDADATADGETAPTLDELEAQAATLTEDVNKLADQFATSLIEFINSQSISEGAELTEVQRQAFNWKADEDLMVAHEYIEKGGEYQRAIDIITTSLLSDPTNEKLLAAKTEAEELRYMTEERLDQVKKKMSQEEVRALLGTPKASNVREFDNGVIGWFYPKEAPGAAASVFFQKKGDNLQVYKTDFNAIKAREQGG